MAIVPPGRSTRTSSVIARWSSWMCSRTSEATTRSNSPSAKGSWRASPSLMSAAAPAGTSPASFIAPNSSSTPASSSASWSKAITSAPRRYISKACRPAPQPMSITRSPGRRPSRSKSTVSMSTPGGSPGRGEVVDDVFVRRCGRPGHRAPAEHLHRADAAGSPHPGPPLRVVEQVGDRAGELADVSGSHQVGTEPVGADHLGDRSGTADDQWRLTGHQLGGRQREALVERRDTGDLGRAHHLHQLGIADPADEAHVLTDAELVDQLLGPPARRGPG